MTRLLRPGLRQPVQVAVLVACAYAVGSSAAFVLFKASSTGAVFFPPAGVTLGALILTRYRNWPWVLAAAGGAELLVDLAQGQSLGYVWGFVLANVAEPLIGAGLVRRAVHDIDLSRRRDLGSFLAFGVVVGPLFGGLIGATTLALGLGRNWVDAFGPFWAGDGLGALTVGGAIVAWRRSRTPWTVRMVLQTAGWLAVTAVVTAASFWPREVPLAYLVIPLLFWFAVRHGAAMVAAAGTVTAITANALTAAGRGPWHLLASSPQLELAALQVFIAVVVLGAWLLAVEIAARDRARSGLQAELTARHRVQALQRVTARLATAATSEEIARVIVRDGISLVADYGVVTLRDRDGGLRRWTSVRSVGAEPGESESRLEPDAAVPTAQVIRTGRPVVVRLEPPVDGAWERRAPQGLLPGSHQMVVPARAGGKVLGALAFGSRAPIDPELVDVAETLAEVTALALERARLYETEHAAAHQLQQALLPTVTLSFPGVRAAVRYRPAEELHDVGGDWYDVFELPDGRIGFAVGDVVGHDLNAAAAMGQLQAVLRVVATAGAGPAAVLDRLDEAGRTIPGADFATVGYAEYSASTGVLRYACAGHPPPLVVTADSTQYLWGGRSQPLAAATAPRPQDEFVVPTGTTLLWYSDGLIEDRRQPVDEGLTRLADVARELSGVDPEECCDAVLTGMTAGRVVDDDVVLVCLRLSRAQGHDQQPLSCRLRSPADLAAARRALREWVRPSGLERVALESLLLVSGEALSNALEHAYRGAAPGVVELLVEAVDPSRLRITVADHGRWRHDHGRPDGGRGLGLINRIAESATLDLSPTGTTVTIVIRTDYSAAGGPRSGALRGLPSG